MHRVQLFPVRCTVSQSPCGAQCPNPRAVHDVPIPVRCTVCQSPCGARCANPRAPSNNHKPGRQACQARQQHTTPSEGRDRVRGTGREGEWAQIQLCGPGDDEEKESIGRWCSSPEPQVHVIASPRELRAHGYAGFIQYRRQFFRIECQKVYEYCRQLSVVPPQTPIMHMTTVIRRLCYPYPSVGFQKQRSQLADNPGIAGQR
jgi:hypothetical protein